MKKLRVGVVGVGHIGGNHARIYSELPNVEFVAIRETDPVRSAENARKFAVPSATSLDEFAGLIDAASVATPTSSHFSIAQDLLTRGKHLLIEKPITETTAEARELAGLAAARGLVLQVGHVDHSSSIHRSASAIAVSESQH